MEKLFFSLSVMVLGLVVVFFGLAILILAIWLLSRLMNGFGKPKGEPEAEMAAPIQAAAPEVEEFAFDGVSPEVVAAITAAIVAMEGGNKRLVVRSVRRAGDAWAQAGRREALNY